ncbi:MAG: Sec-independent protein translocase protein TatB [Pseudomonadota bacterium]
MFDIGFFELFLVCILALLVVGPERLPGLVRSVGGFMGKARRMAQTLQFELEREVDLQKIGGDLVDIKPTGVRDALSDVDEPPAQDEGPDHDLDGIPIDGHGDHPPPSDLASSADPVTPAKTPHE